MARFTEYLKIYHKITPADIAPSALETIIFDCFMGSVSALTYYLLLLLMFIASPHISFKPLCAILWSGEMTSTSLKLGESICCF